MSRVRFVSLLLGTTLLSVTAWGGIFEDLYTGLNLYGTPTGFSGGAQTNGGRLGRVRVVPNRLGRGYRVEVDRTFGNDAFGRPEVYDLGNYELQLSGSTQATFGYTSRGILTGNADILANNLQYTLRGKNGVQDIEVQGRLDVSSQVEVNALGFYTLHMEVNNTNSRLTANGVAVGGDVDTDWDIGPINIRGNVFYDTALTLLSSFGFDTSQAAGLFGGSPVNLISNQLTDLFKTHPLVAGDFATIDTGGGQISDAAAQAARDFVTGLTRGSTADSDQIGPPAPSPGFVPEPSVLVLLSLGSLLVLRRRHW